jgi:opacity protein-like surface antigen
MFVSIFRAAGVLVKCVLLLFSAIVPQTISASDLYLRLGGGMDLTSDAAFSDRNCLNLYPSALYGCGKGSDGLPYRSVGEFESSKKFHLGLGYEVTDRFRVELLIEKRSGLDFVGRANFLATDAQQDVVTPVESTSNLLISYMNVADWNVTPAVDINPYVGLGFGFVRNKCGETRMDFPYTVTTLPEGSTTDFAGVLAVGVSSSLWTQRLALDVEFRYTYLGKVITGRDVGYVTWRSGARDPLALDLDLTRSRLKRLGVSVSVRYSL